MTTVTLPPALRNVDLTSFDEVAALVQHVTNRQLHCSHAHRDHFEDVCFCRSCNQVIPDEELNL
jgi:hypothetical protein